MSILDSRRLRKVSGVAALLILLAGGCASIPYQSMSDARQAIRAAEPVVDADGEGAAVLGQARDLLTRAEGELRGGDYKAARQTAERAKGLAIEAREVARDNAAASP